MMLNHLRYRLTIKKRKHFVRIINQRKYETGVELGVAQGSYSLVLLKSELRKLYLIDKWDDHHDAAEMDEVCQTMESYGDRVTLVRGTFSEEVVKFPDGSFDFIYIDGYAHTGQDDGRTLEEWWPKLKQGGMYSGHDYDEADWPLTKAAVDRFAKTVGRRILVTREDKWNSWYFFK